MALAVWATSFTNSTGCFTRETTASRTMSSCEGTPSPRKAGPTPAGGAASPGLRLKRCTKRPAPEAPSTAAWCTLVMTAKRPPSMPSMTHASHSGRERSSGVLAMRPQISPSSLRPPGAGQATRRTWRMMSKSGSSIHTGWCSSKGTSTKRRRKAGRRCTRLSMRFCTFSKL